MKIYKKVSITAGLLLFVISLPSLGEPYEYCYHNCEVNHNNPYRSFERPHDSRLLTQCRKKCDEAFPAAAEKAEKKAEKKSLDENKKSSWREWCFWCN
ncbi:MAG TPA: hypothetical protein EYO51_07300 [Methylococcaceae bacterium]|jgi:hypothetical protein|nr:hypothetical protein [Methylococcaceae bacterium]HIA45800.1 hypothetical protein [Methylococcaceae bacterium]HIB62927.1 hypothetical protein [Methylococcaceae bacterium]HIO45296.1 hypothetical protein [Methylococcales bacterium]